VAEPTLTYLLVDGETIDGVLGGILNHKPEPHQRPRWNHLLEFAEQQWSQPVRGLFFINATRGIPGPFVQALIMMGFQPIPLSGRADEKVVDIGIQRTLAAIGERSGDVVLASHDADFVDGMSALASAGRRIGVMVFTELIGHALLDVPDIEVFDLETTVGAFEVDLPRLRIIPLDEFDPVRFL
jgi:uncharacterized protein